MFHKISVDWRSPIKIIKIWNYNVKLNLLLYYDTDKNNYYDISLFLFIRSLKVAYDILYLKKNGWGELNFNTFLHRLRLCLQWWFIFKFLNNNFGRTFERKLSNIWLYNVCIFFKTFFYFCVFVG